MKNTLVLVFMSFLAFTGTSIASENHLGKRADFTLIKEKERTNYMIQSGKSLLKIVDLKETQDSSEYLVHWDYNVLVKWAGRRTGTIRLMMPSNIFNESFWSNLQDEPIQTSNLRMTYLGNKSSVILNNETYKNCNVIKIDDVKNSNIHAIKEILKLKALELGLIDQNYLREEKVENIEIEAVTHKDAPVMGVLQWTIQGEVKGYSIKMGFDLIEG